MTEPTTNGGASAEQRRYWNTVAGPRRVQHHEFIERRNRAVDGLLLAHAAAVAGESVLEVGCGTGATLFALAAAVGPRGRVVGVDISEPMLSFARRRMAESGLANVSLVLADAQTYGFEPASFDLVVSRFGVMFFPEPVAAFANLCRAARPGGRLAFACWAPMAENRHWLVPYEIALARLGPPAPEPAGAPGPMSLSDPARAQAILARAGFVAIDICRERIEIEGGTPEEEAEHVFQMGPTARLIEEKKPAEPILETLRREIREAFAAHAAADGSVRLSGTILLVTAGRPAEG
ncbi:MAG TPA: class I SAM-dependent methyltransferase [Stellaceae bacterium]|nr:class I SAM-dependent methyltransferase [Stellaceae bacterium]